MSFYFFFFNDTATTEIYTLSLHDALPISNEENLALARSQKKAIMASLQEDFSNYDWERSEEHTSELQSHLNLVCRLLLEKKKKKDKPEDGRNVRQYDQISDYVCDLSIRLD